VPGNSSPQETPSVFTAQTEETPTNDTKSTGNDKNVGVRHRDFRDGVLQPRNIIIDQTREEINHNPFDHFETPEPKEFSESLAARLASNGAKDECGAEEHDHSECICCERLDHVHTKECLHYTRLPGLKRTTAWLSLTEEQKQAVNAEYKACKEMVANEALYALVSSKLLLREPLRPLDIKKKTRGWKSIMACELAPPNVKSSKRLWEAPPVLVSKPNTQQHFGDLEPDRTFYLDFPGFNPEYSGRVFAEVMFVGSRMTCPYLTVEFKRDADGSSDDIAQNQVLAAGARALYNRWRLRNRRCAKPPERWTPELLDSVRHYGLTLSSDAFVFWCLRPTVDKKTWDWNGCEMYEICSERLSLAEWGVQQFAIWMNEIHRWGLTVHANECENDIKVLLERQRTRTSGVGVRGSQKDEGQEDDADQDDDEHQEDDADQEDDDDQDDGEHQEDGEHQVVDEDHEGDE